MEQIIMYTREADRQRHGAYTRCEPKTPVEGVEAREAQGWQRRQRRQRSKG